MPNVLRILAKTHRYTAGASLVILGYTLPTQGKGIPDSVIADKTIFAEDSPIPTTGRTNIFNWHSDFEVHRSSGIHHAKFYPVTPTGLLIPVRPALKLLNSGPDDPITRWVRVLFKLKGSPNFNDFWSWLGLHPDPSASADRPYPLGVTQITRASGHYGYSATGFTLGCMACHSGNLFGTIVIGATNRFPRSNAFFDAGRKLLQVLPEPLLSRVYKLNPEERALYQSAQKNARSIGVKIPLALGLDTSLAQVALSLARRSADEWASVDPEAQKNPRAVLLDHTPADSKPQPWWNLKYKNRWLADGSVVSGNPILTNLLWNEIGRGADLLEIQQWIDAHPEIIEDLTTAVFATPAPQYSRIFPTRTIDVVRARRGETIYQTACAKCHGMATKDWSAPHAPTLRYTYFERTPVKNVGTDPYRARGMTDLAAALNPLAFSQIYGIQIEVQNGYVPPPLEGIFARYPYFHNNAIPNLCELMTAPELRAMSYVSGEARDPDTDYDHDCVGYPMGAKTPEAWRGADHLREHTYDTRRPGMSNTGHYDRIFRDAGPGSTEKFGPEQKQELREYLKTL